MRVLYVATDLRDADILQQEVKRAAPKLVLDVCAGAAEARARVERTLAYDVMLLDSSVVESEQLLLIQHIRSKQIPLPVAVLANQNAAPSSALISAADECLARGPRLAERLGPALRMAIERYRIVATTLRDNERLKRSEARLRLIIEALPAGVVLVDHTGKILAMNLAGSTLVGTTGPSDVVGREIYSLADADGARQLRDVVTRALAGERGRAEFVCHGPDGANRLLSFDGLCIQRDEATSQGSVLGVLAAASDAAPAEAPVEFSFGGDVAAMADERAALDQALETMRADVERLEQELTHERQLGQQLAAELERTRATAAEHHQQRAALDERSREAAARIEELESQQREEQAAMEAVVSRAGTLDDEASTLREERQRLAHEAAALKQELLDQRRARLELEERIAAAEVDRERLTAALTAARSASEARVAQLDEELRGIKASMAQAGGRERTLTAELNATKFEAARLQDEIARGGDARTRLEAELEAARQQLREAMSTLEAGQTSGAARAAESQAALDEALAREATLAAGIEVATAERLETAHRLAAAEARVAGLERAEYESAASAVALRQDLAASAARLQQLESDLALAAGGRADLESQLSQAVAREQALQTTVAAADGARADLDAQLGQTRQRVGEHEAALAEKAAELEALSGELAGSRFEATQLRDDLARENEMRARLEADVEARAFDLATLSSSADADREVFQARVAELEAEATGLRERATRHAELEASITEMEARRQAAVARVAELEERRRDEQIALSAAAQHQTELAQELVAARDEIARLSDERDAVSQEVARERELRRSIEDDLTVRGAELSRLRTDQQAELAARDAETGAVREELAAGAQALSEARESAARLESAMRGRVAALEADAEQARAALEQATDHEHDLAAELASLQQERDSRGRQAYELEALLARERDERIDLQSRLQVLEREAADAGARAEARLAELTRDHQEVVARLQKLLEQAAAREFQAAALPRPGSGDRVRRRPAEKIGQLAAAMANDLNTTIGDVAEDTRRLLAELPDGAASRARAEQALQTANRAGQLVRHLLRLSERESRLIPRVELSALVRGNEALLRQLAGADIDLRFELAAGLPHVECDAEEMVQVLSTLVVTLRGALPLGGVIRVLTQDRGRGDGRRRTDHSLSLTVSAEGYGMVPVPTAVCEDVVARCGGSFTASVDQSQSIMTLQATLPIDPRNAEAAPGWSQTA